MAISLMNNPNNRWISNVPGIKLVERDLEGNAQGREESPAKVKYVQVNLESEEFKMNNYVSDGTSAETDNDMGTGGPKREIKKINETPMKLSAFPDNSFDEISTKKDQESCPKGKVIPILKERVIGRPAQSKRVDRKDTLGNQIGEGHRIVFAEEISVIHEVESWKEYNTRKTPPRNSCCEVF